jgi:excisionase family DNA binding protein
MESLLNAKEASRALNLSIHTIRLWTSKRKIPFIKLGRKNLFREKDLLEMIQNGYRSTKQ